MSSEWIQTSFQFTVQVNIRIVSLYCRQHCSVMCCSKQTLVQECFNIKLNYTLKTNKTMTSISIWCYCFEFETSKRWWHITFRDQLLH